MPDKYDVCAQIRQHASYPIFNGEHEYTRWGFHKLLEAGAQDVLQPDIFWAGGITEVVKIAALASAYDVEVVPHNHSTYATLHFSASQPPNLCPVQEYLVKWNTLHNFFFTHEPELVNGYVELTQQPGIGWEIDESLVETQQVAALSIARQERGMETAPTSTTRDRLVRAPGRARRMSPQGPRNARRCPGPA